MHLTKNVILTLVFGIMALGRMGNNAACAGDLPLSLQDWTYIQVDNARVQWGKWDEPKWLNYFGLDMADVTGDGYLDIVAGRYVYHNPGADMSDPWARIDLGMNVDGMLFVDVDGDDYGDIIGMALPLVYWLEAQDSAGQSWKARQIGTLKKTGHVNGQGYMLAQIVPGGRPEILLACEDGVYALIIPDDPGQGDWPKRRLAHEVMDEGIGVGDLDADGDIDIVCGRKHNDGFGVLCFVNPGNDSPDWPTRMVGPSEHAPDRIVVAHLNEDQRLDIAVSEERWPGRQRDANLYWYEQGSNQAFQRHLVTTEYSLNNLDVADMDGDGDMDLITCEHKGPRGQQKLQIFANDGTGQFHEHILDRGKESHLGARVADMDGDGDYDIVSAAWDYPEFLHLWRNNALSPQSAASGKIRWQHRSTRTGEIPFADVGNQAAALVFDINQDGIDDIVIAGWSDETSMVWLQKQGAQWQRFLIDQRQSHIEAGGAVCDIDGDGDLDILQGGSWATNELWWWENPYPVFKPDTPWNRYLIKHDGANQHHDQIFGDFDGDGQKELVFWNQSARKLWIADLPPDPRVQAKWQLKEIWSWPQSLKYEGLAQADVDRDGVDDLIGGAMWFKHLGQQRFQANVIDAEYGSSRSAVGDLIRGGRPEIVLGSGDTVGPLNLYEYRDGTWHKTTLIEVVDHGHSLQIADINGDGCLDIFTAEMAHWWKEQSNTDAKLWLLYGNGQGGFELTELQAAEGLGNHESRLGDLDGDGDLDILQKPFEMETPGVNLDIWLNNGTDSIKRSWKDKDHPYRVLLQVGAAGYLRKHAVVEVEIDFTQLLRQCNTSDGMDPTRMRLYEQEKNTRTPVSFQFDRTEDFHPQTRAKGTLTFMLNGITAPQQVRRFELYFGGRTDSVKASALLPLVSVQAQTEHEAQESFAISTPNGRYYYHRLGAGFASLEDREGYDWLSYNPGVGAQSQSGSGGKYRGTPNMGHPEGYCHPGNTVSDTRVLASGPFKATLVSRSKDGKMHCRWDIFPYHARLTVHKMRLPYWFLYEGTPGAKLDMQSDQCIRMHGHRATVSAVAEKWQGDLVACDGLEWLAFTDPKLDRALCVVHHEDDEAIDSYWPMNEEMTVFGFGRLGLVKYLRMTPSHFSISLVDTVDPEQLRRTVNNRCQPLFIAIGPVETSCWKIDDSIKVF